AALVHVKCPVRQVKDFKTANAINRILYLSAMFFPSGVTSQIYDVAFVTSIHNVQCRNGCTSFRDDSGQITGSGESCWGLNFNNDRITGAWCCHVCLNCVAKLEKQTYELSLVSLLLIEQVFCTSLSLLVTLL